ncbi:c-type cytochrome [Streptomyces sp. ACA25]|uniref:cytochrome bc1 complex diheme cytochrome c subunit n=1 Tax=Streptomyces sp. ACA25 TaxID=3022596 RepID=UPI0023077065|nr:c-type cytochrome [Streptomyces sp. ACA25]MDB1089920.1 c-type cytochrome [Streptomyces sp. ACA25]
MKKLSARRRHPLAALVVLIFALAATGGLYAAFSPAGEAQADTAEHSIAVEEGMKLYAVGCSSCHGTGGQGTEAGPSLVGVGAAAVDFQVATGRMPMQNPGPQAPNKPAVYNDAETAQLAAYIASLGPGPSVPEPGQYDPAEGNSARGGELFRTNCAQCHNFTGQGGPLTHGKYAPNLHDVEPKQIYQAMLTGPQNMPEYPDGIMPEQEKRDIIAWLAAVNSSEAPNHGGFSLGGYGPVSEGLFAWTFGIGVLIVASVWVGAHTAKARKS